MQKHGHLLVIRTWRIEKISKTGCNQQRDVVKWKQFDYTLLIKRVKPPRADDLSLPAILPERYYLMRVEMLLKELQNTTSQRGMLGQDLNKVLSLAIMFKEY